ncbi:MULTISPECIES: hypothetical protein [unclassified Streptomyces]|uniref:hypothetical protein n=1 Tax=unclassified Streptomyces TaxID=2593676 RepID=UPI0009C53EC3|nr:MULTISPECIES: hypothetical protein [unclassified Streptomyces]ONI48676.1 hypothetical protein STIB_72300 [Streptomyces sp. IB2014 011-1]
MSEPIVISVALGPHVAAITSRINGRLHAVINTRARSDPRIRTEAAVALVGAGMDAGRTLGALHGVCR